MKVSLIITTKNEEATILSLLESICNQSEVPEEVVIADAGSTDRTVSLISRFKNKLSLRVLSLPASANRAVGRNHAIDQASFEYILITDAGCVLDKDWVREMKSGFSKVSVVAGFYQGRPETKLEAAIVPYALVMPDHLNVNDFLPATRSMGITKSIFAKVGRFSERFRYAEDYAFARKIVELQIPIAVRPKAIVYWRPRSSLQSFSRMIYEHAFGDGYSYTFRPKVALIYIRYATWACLLAFVFLSPFLGVVYIGSILIYVLYSIKKNYRYAPYWQSLINLPVLQLLSDLQVMLGTFQGMLKRKAEDFHEVVT